VIRPVTETDVPALTQVLQQPDVARFWGSYDEAKFRAEVAAASLAWTIEVEGQPAGYVQVWEENDPDWRWVDVDIFVAPEHQGRGIGPDAMRDALRFCFQQRGHHRATLSTSVENERAIKAYEKLGFRRVGVLRKSSRYEGEWKDEFLMELLAEDLR
jgi:aminoglycoside 6'-N-acetyltransferase